MRIYSLLLCAIIGLEIMAQDAMSLNKCIAIGIERNLSMRNTIIETSKSRNIISQNRAKMLPKIIGVAQFTDFIKNPVNVTTGTMLGNEFPDEPTWQTIRTTQYNTTLSLQLDMPLYDQTIYAGIEVAKTIDNLAYISQEKATQDLVVNISRIYYLAQTSMEHCRLVEENIARMDSLCGITEALYGQGVVMLTDLNRIHINLQNLISLKDRYTTLHEQQINILRYLLNLDMQEPLVVEPLTLEINDMADCRVDDKLPELRLANKQIQLIDKNITAVKAGYLPSISFFGQIGTIGYHDSFHRIFHGKESHQNWFENYYVGLSLKVPIFDGNAKRHKLKQLKYEQDQMRNDEEMLRLRLNQNLSNASLQLRHNITEFYAQQENYKLAQDVYEVTANQYKEGVASMTDLLQDEMRLRNAQSACVQAHYQYRLAMLEIQKLSGKINY